MNAIEKLIEEGEKQLQEEIAEKAERTRIKAEKDEAARRVRFEFLQAILPVEVQPYFDYEGFQDLGNLNSYWINLVIPECTRIYIELDTHARTMGDVEVALPDEGYRREPHRVRDLHIGLALARRYYRKEQEIKAQMDEIQRQKDEKMAAEKEAKREEEIASQARNDGDRVDYLGEAIKMMDQFLNTGYPNDLQCSMAYSMMGILEQLKGIE